MSVSRETLDLNHYEDLLKQWNKTINLIAPSTEQSLRERHIDDSLQLPRLIAPTRQSCADFGSGGGLPGIVYAIATREQAAPITLVESDQRKAAFLRACIREIGLSHATVIARRVEEINHSTSTLLPPAVWRRWKSFCPSQIDICAKAAPRGS